MHSRGASIAIWAEGRLSGSQKMFADELGSSKISFVASFGGPSYFYRIRFIDIIANSR